MRSPDGRLRYSGVWGKPPSPGVTAQGYRDLFAWNYAENQALFSDRVLVDVAVGEAGKRLPVAERARRRCEAGGEDTQDQARRPRRPQRPRRARLRLGENDKALDDLNAVLAKSKDDSNAFELRAIAQARLGKKEPALADLARYRKDAPDSVPALPGGRRRGGTRRRRRRRDRGPGSRAAEGAGRRRPAVEPPRRLRPGLEGRRPERPRESASPGRAGARLASEAVRDNDLSFALLDDSLYFDPIRDDPAFGKLLDAGHPERRFARRLVHRGAVRGGDPRRPRPRRAPEARPGAGRPGLSPGRVVGRPHVARRPAAVGLGLAPAAGRGGGQGPARRAPGAGRWPWCGSGKAESVWPLLRHSADPRLRSFIVNWLNPLGADPHAVAAELDRSALWARALPAHPTAGLLEAPLIRGPSIPGRGGDPAPARGTPSDGRRPLPSRDLPAAGLDPGAGTYGTEGLSPGEREPLAAKLLAVYRDDPDAGVHGAAAWTLRHDDVGHRHRSRQCRERSFGNSHHGRPRAARRGLVDGRR